MQLHNKSVSDTHSQTNTVLSDLPNDLPNGLTPAHQLVIQLLLSIDPEARAKAAQSLNVASVTPEQANTIWQEIEGRMRLLLPDWDELKKGLIIASEVQ